MDAMITMTPEFGQPSTGPAFYFLESWRLHGDAARAIRGAAAGKRGQFLTPNGMMFVSPA